MKGLAIFGLLAAAIWLAALPLVRLHSFSPSVRLGLGVGWAAAGASGALSFGLLLLANGRSVTALIGAVAGGFLARAAVAVIGVLAALHLGVGAGAFCLSFFALYWVFFGLECLALVRSLARQRVSSQALLGSQP